MRLASIPALPGERILVPESAAWVPLLAFPCVSSHVHSGQAGHYCIDSNLPPNPSFCYVTHRYHHNMRQPYQPSCQQTLTSHQCDSNCAFTTAKANQELRYIYLSVPFSVSANIKLIFRVYNIVTNLIFVGIHPVIPIAT